MSAPPDIEAAVRAAMRAVFAGDLAALERAAVPNPHLRVLVENRPRIEDLDRKIDEIQMHVIAEQADGRLIVHAFFMGMIMPITMAPQPEGGWKADLRWWIASAQPPRELEGCCRAFMFAMLSGDDDLLARASLAHPRSALLTAHPAPSGELGQYENVCQNMPMTELAVGETFPWPGGPVYTVRTEDVTDDRRILMGQFGGSEITFILRRVEGHWKVDPEPFVIAAMMRG